MSAGIANYSNAQYFMPPVTNPYGLNPFVGEYGFPAFSDLDADGDYDLFIGDIYGNLMYYENAGSSVVPQFLAPVQNPFQFTAAYSIAVPTFGDLDNDGDFDLILGEYESYSGLISFYENVGTLQSPEFAPPIQNPFGIQFGSSYGVFPELADIDGDGDLDIIMATNEASFIYYFENIGSLLNPSFLTPVQNAYGLGGGGPWSAPEMADMDDDGDLDMFINEYYGELVYYENIGTSISPVYTTPALNPFGFVANGEMASPAICDLDNDGDLDLLIVEYEGDLIYFENQGTNSLNEFEIRSVVFPNPFIDEIQLQSEREVSHIVVINSSGKVISTIKPPYKTINLECLERGTYILEIQFKDGGKSIQNLVKYL
jgi:hypothetical protein